jgi:hypothetical protein
MPKLATAFTRMISQNLVAIKVSQWFQFGKLNVTPCFSLSEMVEQPDSNGLQAACWRTV